MTHRPVSTALLALAVLGSMSSVASLRGETLTMQNGTQFDGLIRQIAELGRDALDENRIHRIFVVDDGLRYTYLSERLHVSRVGGELRNVEVIELPNQPMRVGRKLASVGRILRAEPFDQHGRRRLTLSGATTSGELPFVQAITEINPLYVRVEGVQGKNGYIIDMRIKTSSIPRETLNKILRNYIDRNDRDERLRIVRLYIEAERYRDARVELQKIIDEFPESDELKVRVDVLGQAMARRLIDEIELRINAGQYSIVSAMIDTFPTDGIANETRLKVIGLRDRLDAERTRRDRILGSFAKDIAKLTDPTQQKVVQDVADEINAEVNRNNLDRLVDYERLAEDEDSTVQQKLALAVSGWYLGPGNGQDDLAVATSLPQVRDIVFQYLKSTLPGEREALLAKLNNQEGGAPKYVADLVAHLKLEPTLPEPEGVPGLYRRKIPAVGDLPEMEYLIQLPPDYDPYRRYPCIVALHGGTAPAFQINWWAGPYNDALKMRLGQASRHGYVVIAPDWQRPGQTQYGFSTAEHHAVLGSLRESLDDFSIDSDRVFLTGYSSGANAAWDIALAHPDVWAGIALFSPNGIKYVTKYWQNGVGLPMYMVYGQLDGTMMVDNSIHLDRYLTRPGFDCTVVEYQGRGHERFGDEIQRVFDWMNKPGNRRRFDRREFEMVAMRPLDNFFWWLEVDQYPAKNMVSPFAWSRIGPKTSPAKTEGKIKGANRLEISTVAHQVRIGLSPDIVDFAEELHISVNGRDLRDELKGLKPSAAVILEDVRTRGDRLHPYWAVIETRGSRSR